MKCHLLSTKHSFLILSHSPQFLPLFFCHSPSLSHLRFTFNDLSINLHIFILSSLCSPISYIWMFSILFPIQISYIILYLPYLLLIIFYLSFLCLCMGTFGAELIWSLSCCKIYPNFCHFHITKLYTFSFSFNISLSIYLSIYIFIYRVYQKTLLRGCDHKIWAKRTKRVSTARRKFTVYRGNRDFFTV